MTIGEGVDPADDEVSDKTEAGDSEFTLVVLDFVAESAVCFGILSMTCDGMHFLAATFGSSTSSIRETVEATDTASFSSTLLGAADLTVASESDDGGGGGGGCGEGETRVISFVSGLKIPFEAILFSAELESDACGGTRWFSLLVVVAPFCDFLVSSLLVGVVMGVGASIAATFANFIVSLEVVVGAAFLGTLVIFNASVASAAVGVDLDLDVALDLDLV